MMPRNRRRQPSARLAAARALGWAVLDGEGNVLARANEPLLYAVLPFEKNHASGPNSVYTDGIMEEGNDTFVVFAGGADSVVEAVRIQVTVVPREQHLLKNSSN